MGKGGTGDDIRASEAPPQASSTHEVAPAWMVSMFSQAQASSPASQTPLSAMASSMQGWALPSQASIFCAVAAAARARMATEYFIFAVVMFCKNNERVLAFVKNECWQRVMVLRMGEGREESQWWEPRVFINDGMRRNGG